MGSSTGQQRIGLAHNIARYATYTAALILFLHDVSAWTRLHLAALAFYGLPFAWNVLQHRCRLRLPVFLAGQWAIVILPGALHPPGRTRKSSSPASRSSLPSASGTGWRARSTTRWPTP